MFSKLLNLALNAQQQPKISPEIPAVQPVVDISEISEKIQIPETQPEIQIADPEPVKPEEKIVPKIKTREDQLAESQKLVPLQMRSSFLPSETCPRDVIAVSVDSQKMDKNALMTA